MAASPFKERKPDMAQGPRTDRPDTRQHPAPQQGRTATPPSAGRRPAGLDTDLGDLLYDHIMGLN